MREPHACPAPLPDQWFEIKQSLWQGLGESLVPPHTTSSITDNRITSQSGLRLRGNHPVAARSLQLLCIIRLQCPEK